VQQCCVTTGFRGYRLGYRFRGNLSGNLLFTSGSEIYPSMAARAREGVSFSGNGVSFMRVGLLTPVLTSTVNALVRT
jgi:hypothetical protein